MTFVPWEDYGICKSHALPRTRCKRDECPLKHPSQQELRRIWDAHDERKSSRHYDEESDWPQPVSRGTIIVSNERTRAREEPRPAPHTEKVGPREQQPRAPRAQAEYWDSSQRAEVAPGSGVSQTYISRGPSPPMFASTSFHETDSYRPQTWDPREDRQHSGQRFDPARSSNDFVNGALIYRFMWGKPLCVRCGIVGHLPFKCSNEPLSVPEQNYLYDLVREEQNRSRREDPKPGSLEARTASADEDASIKRQVVLERSSLISDMMEDSSSPTATAGDGSSFWKRYRERKERETSRKGADAPQHGLTTQIHHERSLKNSMDGTEDELPSFATGKPRDMELMKDERRRECVKVDANPAALAPDGASNFMHPSRAALLSSNPPPATATPVATAFVSKGHPGKSTMGATKRMSNGEAKIIGPHPSTIRVSTSYSTQAAIDKRLAPEGLDAQERSLAEAREDTVRLQGVAWLDNVRRALQLPVKTFTTAVVYYHKFRLAHPKEDYQWVDAAAASLLTSCKNEDTLKKSRDILAAAYNLKQPNTHEQVGADDPMFEAQSRMVIGIERLILESGSFDFRSRAPHHTLVKIGKSLPHSPDLKEVSQLAWTVLTDLHRTFAPLKQTSSTLALASLELAAHLTAAKSEDSTCTVRDTLQNLDWRKWHTTREEVMETLLDGLDLYTHNTGSSILGTKYSLEDLLRIRLSLNKECSSSNLPRYTVIQPPPSPDNANGTSNTLRVSNGHPTPVSPPQSGAQAPQPVNAYTATSQHTPQTDGTLRFMLNPQRATEERAEVNRFYAEEWEEYEEEIEVPLPRDHRSHDGERERDGQFRRDRDRETFRDRDCGPPYGFDARRNFDERNSVDRRGPRDSPRAPVQSREPRPPRANTTNMLQSVVRAPSPAPEIVMDSSEANEIQRGPERPRERARSRERDRAYDDRRYDSRRDRDGRDDRSGGVGSRRYHDDDRRRDYR